MASKDLLAESWDQDTFQKVHFGLSSMACLPPTALSLAGFQLTSFGPKNVNWLTGAPTDPLDVEIKSSKHFGQ